MESPYAGPSMARAPDCAGGRCAAGVARTLWPPRAFYAPSIARSSASPLLFHQPYRILRSVPMEK